MAGNSESTGSEHAHRAALIAIGMAFGAALVLRLLLSRFSVDELEHAHASWLISIGRSPFRDFFEVHPPFVWPLFGALLRLLPEAPESLFALRALCLAGNALCIAASLLLAARLFGGARVSLVACLGVLAASREDLLNFLVAIRPDWTGTLVLLAVFYELARPSGGRRWFVIALGAVTSAAFNPKVVLWASAALLESARLARREHHGLLRLMFGGVAGAVLVAGTSAAWDFSLVDAGMFVFLFHAHFNEMLGVHAFLQKIAASPADLVIAAGAVYAIFTAKRSSSAPGVTVALALASLAYPFVARPAWAQYHAIWILFCLPLSGPMLAALVRPLRRALEPAAALAGGLGAAWCLWISLGAAGAWAYVTIAREVLDAVPPNAHVVAPLRLHPVFRDDAFYIWAQSVDSHVPPRVTTERIFSLIPGGAELTESGRLRRELDSAPELYVVGWPLPDIDVMRSQFMALKRLRAERAHAVDSTPLAKLQILRFEAVPPRLTSAGEEAARTIPSMPAGRY